MSELPRCNIVSLLTCCVFLSRQVMVSVTVGSVNATPVTLATTATARQRHRAAFQMTGRCAAGEAAVCAAAVSALSPEPLEKPAKNAPLAPMPAAQRGKCRAAVYTCGLHSPSWSFTCLFGLLIFADRWEIRWKIETFRLSATVSSRKSSK